MPPPMESKTDRKVEVVGADVGIPDGLGGRRRAADRASQDRERDGEAAAVELPRAALRPGVMAWP